MESPLNIVLLGEAGQGKSLVGSRLVDLFRSRDLAPFESGNEAEAKTTLCRRASFHELRLGWPARRYKVTVMDTPGFNSAGRAQLPNGRPVGSSKALADYIWEQAQELTGGIHLFAIVRRAESTRMTQSFIDTVKLLKTYFDGAYGKRFEDNLCVVFTKWGEEQDRLVADSKLNKGLTRGVLDRPGAMQGMRETLKQCGIGSLQEENCYFCEMVHLLPPSAQAQRGKEREQGTSRTDDTGPCQALVQPIVDWWNTDPDAVGMKTEEKIDHRDFYAFAQARQDILTQATRNQPYIFGYGAWAWRKMRQAPVIRNLRSLVNWMGDRSHLATQASVATSSKKLDSDDVSPCSRSCSSSGRTEGPALKTITTGELPV